MQAISDRELYELYLGALGHCTTKLLNRNDEEIEHELFEEFDVGAHSFLHETSLRRLHEGGFIDQATLEESKVARREWMELHGARPRIAEIRSSCRWRGLFELCDRLLLKQLGQILHRIKPFAS